MRLWPVGSLAIVRMSCLLLEMASLIVMGFRQLHYVRNYDRGRTLEIDEFRTTMLCCKCQGVMEGKVVDGAKSWTARVCTNQFCRAESDRNVNAAINILYLFRCYVAGKERPLRFRRDHKLLDDADGKPLEPGIFTYITFFAIMYLY